MSDAKKQEKPAAAPAPAADAAPAKKGGLPIKTIAVVAVIMIAEGAGVYFIFGATGPKATHGAEKVEIKDNKADETVELELVKGKFQNLQTGSIWFWEAELFIQVKNKYKAQVEKMLEERNAEIREGITQIFSRAQTAQLREPERQSLNRQITAYLRKILVNDDKAGEPLFERVLIPTCNGYRGLD